MQEGDPHIKGKIAQISREKSQQRMMQNVPDATVIVTNPTHFAVALKYEEGMPAPICVAKGQDNIALKIREIGKENDVLSSKTNRWHAPFMPALKSTTKSPWSTLKRSPKSSAMSCVCVVRRDRKRMTSPVCAALMQLGRKGLAPLTPISVAGKLRISPQHLRTICQASQSRRESCGAARAFDLCV